MPVTTISLTALAPVSVLVAVAVSAQAGAVAHRMAAMLVEPSKIGFRRPMVLLPAWAVRTGSPPLSPFPYQSSHCARQKQTNAPGFRETVTKAKPIASPKAHQSRTNHLLVCKWYSSVAEMSPGGGRTGSAPSVKRKG